MKKKNYLTLDEEFLLYCQLNNIDDIDKLAKETFNRGFTILKYGETPYKMSNKEKVVEVVKEVPVEKIIEIIKEVPVYVDKVQDNTPVIEELLSENQKLKNELNEITKALEGMNKARYMKNSDLNSLYDE